MSSFEPITADLARSIADAVSGVNGVAELHGGPHGEVATLFPGQRVRGVRVVDERLQVHVVADLSAVPEGHTLHEVSESVRRAAGSLTHLPVDIFVADAIASSPQTA
ncbi:hypothetical protein [Corynebacterium tapiri]|uniref:Asp23/Gls24 family envelope stress response protein n=1 Tax=Corynebacterium tapiri TaxID=1448266 RepID=A0A5C4U6I8_9CORY|nr:hypothetical protein [Corynebacterium tapiri]TNL98574.1 hypothetical protein FHE74_05070 [Corynebacterium tapiri]